MIDILTLGFLIGLGHAIEADHLAAVSSMAARERGVRRILRHGLSWGAGHALTLLLIAGAAMLLRATLDQRLAGTLDLVVGLMLIGLGGRVIIRLLRDRIHVHQHRHEDGTAHLHAHSHREDPGRHADRHAGRHEHPHPRGLALGSFAIGLVHGMAGSAALIVLAASALASPMLGLAYVSLFGLGSILGMAMLSTVIAVPLAWSARTLTWTNHLLQAGIGGVAIVIGWMTVAERLPALLGTG